jgi:hypothetical protein
MMDSPLVGEEMATEGAAELASATFTVTVVLLAKFPELSVARADSM